MGPKRFSLLHPRLLMAGILMVIGFGALAGTAAAQDEAPEEPTSVVTWVRTCLEPGCTEDLSLTEAVDGVTVDVADPATGESLGTCVTGDLEPGACAVEVTGVDSVTITLDEAGFPDGYRADDNPATLDFANGTEYPFLLMPVDGFPDEEAPPADEPPADEPADDGDDTVEALPSTGAGANSGQPDTHSTTLMASLAIVAALGLAGLGARVMNSHRI